MLYTTKITRNSFAGKTDAFERDNTDKRGLNPRKSARKNTAEPARTRTGKAFPGGRTLRRAFAELSARRKAAAVDKDQSRTKPGRMR